MTGLTGAVDAAIVNGGPVDKAWGKENAQNLPFGMPGIIGNDMGFDHEPTTADFNLIGALTRNMRNNVIRKYTKALVCAGRKFRGALALMILGSGGIVLTACQTQGELVQQESNLAAAGFVVQIANTAERQAMLSRLPANQFVLRVHEGVRHYVYADPGCGCLYVGSPQAFDQYVSNQQLDFAQAQQMAVQDYVDPAWNWAAWGPWGPLGPLYGPGIGGW